MAINEHYYCLDNLTGIYYRCVGLTTGKYAVVYPKYAPLLNGDRGNGPIRYFGLNYPTDSIRFLNSHDKWVSNNVNMRFDDKFNCFVPMARLDTMVLYASGKRLASYLRQDSFKNMKKSITAQIIEKFITMSDGLLKETDFGIDASRLVGMERENSDIDLVIYTPQKAKIVRSIYQKMVLKNIIKGPDSSSQYFISRRKAYSPLMTKEEIIEWEKRKISGLYKNIKFSIMIKDPKMKDKDTYIHTNQYCAIRCRITKDTVVADPGYIELSEKSKIEIIWGPQNINIKKIITNLPSRMGVFLKKGDKIFSIGKLYRIVGTENYALTQMPWDEELTHYETRFVTKIEQTKLDHLVNELFNMELAKNG